MSLKRNDLKNKYVNLEMFNTVFKVPQTIEF